MNVNVNVNVRTPHVNAPISCMCVLKKVLTDVLLYVVGHAKNDGRTHSVGLAGGAVLGRDIHH